MKFKRGMTILERRQIREEILQKEISEAYRRANDARLTLRCRNAMFYTGSHPETARELHAMCKGEERGNGGCLCLCHDTITGGVETGQMTEIT